MTSIQSSGPVKLALWFAPVVVVMAAFFASIPWLRDFNDAVVIAVAAAAAIFVMGWAVYVAARKERDMDEVQRAGQRFAYTKGAVGGSIATVLLLIPPPVTGWFVDNLSFVTTGSKDVAGRDTVLLAIVFGFMLLSVMQMLGAMVASVVWRRSMQ